MPVCAKREHFLHGDDVALHAGDLLEADDLAPAVGQARDLDDGRQGGADLLPRDPRRHVHAGYADHVFQARQRVARGIGMDRRHRAFVTGIHRLQHVDCLGAAHLADDDAVRTHAQTVANQRALRHVAFAFDVGRARLQAHHVRLLQLQLRCVLDGDNAFVSRNERRQNIEQRRLAASRSARDDEFDLGLDERLA